MSDSCQLDTWMLQIVKGLVTKLYERSSALSGGNNNSNSNGSSSSGGSSYHLPIRRSNARYSVDECVQSIRQVSMYRNINML